MFSISAAVALQNLLFILPTMNQYASFTMFYSLILGGYIFYIYKKSIKKWYVCKYKNTPFSKFEFYYFNLTNWLKKQKNSRYHKGPYSIKVSRSNLISIWSLFMHRIYFYELNFLDLRKALLNFLPTLLHFGSLVWRPWFSLESTSWLNELYGLPLPKFSFT